MTHQPNTSPALSSTTGTSPELTRRALLGGALVGAATLAGCGGSSQGGNKKTTIEIWDISLEQKELHQRASEEYERTHKGVTIDWRSIQEAQYEQTLPLAFRSRKAPDLFQYGDQGPASLSYVIEQGWVRPLDPDGNDVPDEFKNRWPNPQENIPDGILAQDGKTYGYPFNDRKIYGPGYMFLHKKLFQKAGLDPDDPPTTWSELKKACSTLKKRTGTFPIAVPMKDNNLNRFYLSGIASGIMTDNNFDFQTGQFSVADDRMLEAFEFTQELYNAGYIKPGLYDKDFARGEFAADQAAIYIDGSYMTGVWRSNGFDSSNYTVHAHPYPDSGKSGRLGYSLGQGGFWVNSETENPEAVWEFIQWLSDPKGWFAKNYIEGGFGFLLGADNAEYVKDPADKHIVEIASTDNFRIAWPTPVLKCPDVAKSKAYLDATTQHPEWETEERTKALLENSDLKPAAVKVASGRQKILEEGLEKEEADGLDVSMDCYTFPDWQFTEDYKISNYA